jgi:ketosteroid isomerase-like protein
VTPQEIFQRLVVAGMRKDADAQAALFAPDGVFEAPLVPVRLAGRDEVRAGFAALHERAPAEERKVDFAKTGYVLHTTADPDVFIAEIDTAFEGGGSMSLVQILRVRDGHIVLMRDYFDPAAWA